MGNKAKLLIALAVCYFGDYCAFVSLLEISRRLVGNQASVLTFLVYSIPALVMIGVAKVWARSEYSEKTQLIVANCVGFFVSLGLVAETSKYWILFSALILGLVKEMARTLVNGLIKKFFEPTIQGALVSNVVTLRFVVMIIGGSVGAYLASGDFYKEGFLFQGLAFLVAAGLIYSISKPRHVLTDRQNFEPHNSRSFYDFSSKLSVSLMLLMVVSLVAVGSFMSLEYPLLVSGLGVDPKWIWMIYVGHVVGALLAQFLLIRKMRMATKSSIEVLCVFQIISFLLVGCMGTNFFILSVQIGICAFLMVLFESQMTACLMKLCTELEYPLFNIWLRSIGLLSEFLGALVAFVFLYRFTLVESNLFTSACALALSFVIVMVTRFRLRQV